VYGFILVVRQYVAVDIQGHRGLRLAEGLLHDVQARSVGEHQGSESVPQIVKAEGGGRLARSRTPLGPCGKGCCGPWADLLVGERYMLKETAAGSGN
jgi:hypothetical protein